MTIRLGFSHSDHSPGRPAHVCLSVCLSSSGPGRAPPPSVLTAPVLLRSLLGHLLPPQRRLLQAEARALPASPTAASWPRGCAGPTGLQFRLEGVPSGAGALTCCPHHDGLHARSASVWPGLGWEWGRCSGAGGGGEGVPSQVALTRPSSRPELWPVRSSASPPRAPEIPEHHPQAWVGDRSESTRHFLRSV